MESIAAIIYLLSPLLYVGVFPLSAIQNILIGQVLTWAVSVGAVHLMSLLGQETQLMQLAVAQLMFFFAVKVVRGTFVETATQEKRVGLRTLITIVISVIPVVTGIAAFGIRMIPVPSPAWDMTVHYRMMQQVYESGRITAISYYPFGFPAAAAYTVRAMEAVAGASSLVHISGFGGFVFLLYVMLTGCIDLLINATHRRSWFVTVTLSIVGSALVSSIHLPFLYQGFISVYFFLIPFVVYGFLSGKQAHISARLRALVYVALFYLMGVSYWYYAPVVFGYIIFRIITRKKKYYWTAALGYALGSVMGLLPFFQVKGYGGIVVGSPGYFMQPGTAVLLFLAGGLLVCVRYGKRLAHLTEVGILGGIFGAAALILAVIGKDQLYPAYKMSMPVLLAGSIFSVSWFVWRVGRLKKWTALWTMMTALAICTYALVSYQSSAGLIALGSGGFHFFRNNTNQLSEYLKQADRDMLSMRRFLPVESEPRSMHWALLLLNEKKNPLFDCMNPKQTEPQYRACIQKQSIRIARSAQQVRWVDMQRLLLTTCNRELFSAYIAGSGKNYGLSYDRSEFEQYCADKQP